LCECVMLSCRELKGKAIAETPSQIQRVDEVSYKVNSQSGNGPYDVHFSTIDGWRCSCPDHTYRNVKCKHICAVEFSFAIRQEVKVHQIEPLSNIEACRYCQSIEIIKWGVRHNKYGGIQKFSCKSCGRFFTVNLGFEKMKHNPQAVTTAMQLYFSGESLRNTAKSLRLLGVQVSHQTVYNWIEKYTTLMEKYLDKITPQVGDTWRADELYLKVKGDTKYLFALMDDETRFWIAQQVASTKYTSDIRPLFAKGRAIAEKQPKVLITDGAHNFHDAYMKEFWTIKYGKTKHIKDIRMGDIPHNNKMERLNGEIRDREKVMRSLKKPDTPILTGYQIYHNYVRPHMALDGQTPADKAGIHIDGENKWLTIIQNASRSRAEMK